MKAERMEAEKWQEVERLYHEASELTPPERADFLARACAGDDNLRREVESLLAYETRADKFIETSALRATARALQAERCELKAGQMIGNYRVLGRLGHGGMGVVYKAHDTKLGRTVALKLLPVASALYGDEQSLLLREARAASVLTHPHIATIYEVNEHDGIGFIALEYVEGASLASLPAGIPLKTTRVIRIGMQLADALDEAHRKGVVHRDIKPANVMLDARGQVKILDFGIAKLIERTTGDTGQLPHFSSPTVPQGSAPYVSPEQARGLPLDHRTDIFSLGVVLYELATGRRAFRGDTAEETIRSVVSRPHLAPRTLNPDIPPRLEAIINRCLEKDRERRYSDAKELTRDLAELLPLTDVGAALLSKMSGTWAIVKSPAVHGMAAGKSSWPKLAAIVAVVVLLVGVASIALYLKSSRETLRRQATGNLSSKINSLAVLPFQTLSPDAKDEFLGLGLTDTLINRLSSVRNLNVRSTEAVRRYAGKGMNPIDVGRELQVEAVLEGNVRKAGDRIRLTARLLDVRSGATLWAGDFDEQFTDIFAVEDRLSRNLTGALTLRLSNDELAQVEKHYTRDAEAYALYLNGRFSLNRFTEDGTKMAREYFRKAIERDPNYSQAYAGLAESFAFGEIGLPPEQAFPQAREAATRALALDSSLGAARAVLAQVEFLDEWDWSGAEREFKLALALTPNQPEIHHMYAHYLTAMGRLDEALAESKRFIELDPISPTPVQHLGWHYLYAHEFDKAIEQYKRVLVLDPNYTEAHRQLADAYWQKGMHDEAVAEMEKQLTLQGRSREDVVALGEAYKLSGWHGYWQKRLEINFERAKSTYIAPSTFAECYSRSGDHPRALEWLEKAYERRDHQLVYLSMTYDYAELRPDPRFQNLLGRMKLK
ncbi:MAG TPA: protein kinase [Pyrinomonadaceae bacterium]|nr:protein kinase [Pyrinomonadaceae bacterium]